MPRIPRRNAGSYNLSRQPVSESDVILKVEFDIGSGKDVASIGDI